MSRIPTSIKRLSLKPLPNAFRHRIGPGDSSDARGWKQSCSPDEPSPRHGRTAGFPGDPGNDTEETVGLP